jgi:hypothetical protein
MTVGSQVKQTVASLKGIQATLEVYAKQSEEENTKTVFTETAEITKEIVEDLEARVKVLEFQEPQYKGY